MREQGTEWGEERERRGKICARWGEAGGRVKDSMQIFKISHPRNQKMHFFLLLEKQF